LPAAFFIFRAPEGETSSNTTGETPKKALLPHFGYVTAISCFILAKEKSAKRSLTTSRRRTLDHTGRHFP
jgi:hypothetical protein